MSSGKEKKPVTTPPAASSDFICIKIWSQDNSKNWVKIKRSTELQKLVELYCVRKGISAESCRFLFHGARLNGRQTPEELGLDDGDQIDVMLDQDGGCKIDTFAQSKMFDSVLKWN